MNEKLLAITRFYFAQSVFMNNIHYKAYKRINKRKKIFSFTVLTCASATLLLLILQLISIENNCNFGIKTVSYVGLLVTAITLIVELLNKENLTLIMCQHRTVAEKYKVLRDEYMNLIEDIMSGFSSESDLRIKKDSLQKQYSTIGENAPETTTKDYKNTQSGLGLAGNSNEEFTWSDIEIDRFLPQLLRIT
jgi:hypothetical protein